MQKGHWGASGYQLELMDDRTRVARYVKRTNISKSFKALELVDSYNLRRPELCSPTSHKSASMQGRLVHASYGLKVLKMVIVKYSPRFVYRRSL